MRILIDLGHPAHVHYFKYMIGIMQSHGYEFVVVSREKEISLELLKAYNIPFISRGKGRSSLLGKLLYLIQGSRIVYKIARKSKVDLFLSFASPYNAIASFFLRKINISLDDTEHNVFNHTIYVPLSDSVLTPVDFKKDYGKKHIRFDATMDIAYLHPKYFIPKPVKFISREDNLSKNIIMRFVSWEASHDINHSGFGMKDIELIISRLSAFANIHISSEKKLPGNLARFAIKIKPEEMHSYIAASDLFISESGSMATEAAYLGTHSIVLNSASKSFGVFDRLSKYETFYIADNPVDVLETALNLLKRHDLKSTGKDIAQQIIRENINLTDFTVWFVENYPQSVDKMKQNPDFQYSFR
jgi:uncharacterized protein